jgi:predicted DNA-binding transcriptional regulator AlpA
MEALSVSELSRRSGISRQSIYRSISRGELRRFELVTPGRKPRYGEEAVGYLTRIIRQRIDSPWRPIPRQEEGRVQN